MKKLLIISLGILLCFSCKKNLSTLKNPTMMESYNLSKTFQNEQLRIEVMYKPLEYLIQIDNNRQVINDSLYNISHKRPK